MEYSYWIFHVPAHVPSFYNEHFGHTNIVNDLLNCVYFLPQTCVLDWVLYKLRDLSVIIRDSLLGITKFLRHLLTTFLRHNPSLYIFIHHILTPLNNLITNLSNLQCAFSSKIFEMCHLTVGSFLKSNKNYDTFQSGFWKHHNTVSTS